MKTLRRTLVSLAALFFALNAFSQSMVLGNVQDAFLGTPLLEARISLLLASDSSVVIDSIKPRAIKRPDGTMREAQFTITPPKNKTAKYLIRAMLKGYETAYQVLSIDADETRIWGLDDPLLMRKKSETNLSQVNIKATQVKMYWKGDTIVYDASAFKLPDGSMLDDLIRQMPGVTMNDGGEIFVNGRKIDELQLGSRSFMGGNSKVMLENLPYYTVKNIKVYEQTTDYNRAMGAEIDKKKYVMDVHLKPEFQLGYIGNAEIAGGTQDRWLGRAFLLGFTKNTRYTFTANSNNVNETRHIGSQDHWTPNAVPRSLLTTNSLAGDLDYQSSDKNIKDNLNVNFTSTRDKGEMQRRNELFLPDDPLQTTHQTSLTKEDKLQLKNSFKFIKPKKYMIENNVTLGHRSYSGHSHSFSEQYVDTLTLRQRNDGFNDGENWNANFYAQYAPTLKKLGKMEQFFRFKAHLDYTSDENERAERYDIRNFANPATSKTHNANDYSMHKIEIRTPIYYSLHLNNKNDNYIEVTPSYKRDKTHDWLYHPDTLQLPSHLDMLQAITDPSNSYTSDMETFKTNVFLSYARYQKLRKTEIVPWEPEVYLVDLSLNVAPTHERLNYQRGQIDTVVTRNSVRIEHRASLQLYADKNWHRPMLFEILHFEDNTPLVNLIPFRDDANPLVVRLGNPNITDWDSRSVFRFEYKDIRSARHNFVVSALYHYTHRTISQSVSFNPHTGVYTYRPENIHGCYEIMTKGKFFFTIDKPARWTVETTTEGNFNHNLDHTMLAGETQSHVNAVNTFTLKNNSYLQYHKNALNLRATADVNWRHSKGKMRDFETLNALDFNYGVATRYTVSKIKTTLSLDANVYSRRGYGSSSLNTDDFVLNASISQPFMKGKLISRIEAFDLLHRLSSTQYEVNAQGRVETRYRSLPHYVMAHLVYHFNINPKKKK